MEQTNDTFSYHYSHSLGLSSRSEALVHLFLTPNALSFSDAPVVPRKVTRLLSWESPFVLLSDGHQGDGKFYLCLKLSNLNCSQKAGHASSCRSSSCEERVVDINIQKKSLNGFGMLQTVDPCTKKFATGQQNLDRSVWKYCEDVASLAPTKACKLQSSEWQSALRFAAGWDAIPNHFFWVSKQICSQPCDFCHRKWTQLNIYVH